MTLLVEEAEHVKADARLIVFPTPAGVDLGQITSPAGNHDLSSDALFSRSVVAESDLERLKHSFILF